MYPTFNVCKRQFGECIFHVLISDMIKVECHVNIAIRFGHIVLRRQRIVTIGALTV